MPVVLIHMLEGRSKAKKRVLVRKVTEALTETLAVPAERVRVIISEVPGENWAVAGLPIAEYMKKREHQAKRPSRRR